MNKLEKMKKILRMVSVTYIKVMYGNENFQIAYKLSLNCPSPGNFHFFFEQPVVNIATGQFYTVS